VHFYASQAAYAVTDPDAGLSGYGDGVLEIQRQIDANRLNLSSGYTGSVFFHTSAYIQLFRDIKESHFQFKSLCPPMEWKVKERLSAPTDFIQTDSILSWSHPTSERFTLYAYPRGIEINEVMSNPQYFKKVIYGNSYNMIGLGDISQLSIAVCAYDRYGVEHEAAVYNGEGYYDYPQVIFWELNGGTVDVELPKYVTETYILPIARKEGYEFAGWYKTKTFRGNALTEIVDGWEGTLYAKWKALPTDIHTFPSTTQIAVYDLMGRYVGYGLPQNTHGIFIVIQGNKQIKVVL
jgi:uncharacterized repeat protein (TIGR02543 family)